MQMRTRPTQLSSSHPVPRTRTSITTTTSRHTSTATTPTPTPTQTRKSPWPRRLIYATIFTTLGIYTGKQLDALISTPPIPDTEEDSLVLTGLQNVYDKATPLVQDLRADPEWEESDVYGNYSEMDKRGRLTSGPLRGSRGLGLQKVFYNAREQASVSSVFLGEGLEGWPTVVHGGVLATVLDENLGRVAIRSFPERTGVTANLNITYRKPVYSGNFYTFHSRLDRERSTDRKAFVVGEVKDSAGKLCVQAEGLFVVPKKYKLKTIGDEY